jgi:helix-turn-helix protein
MKTKMVEVNCATGEVIEREMTEAELKAEKQLQEAIANEQGKNDLTQTPEALAIAALKAAEKASLLNRLGLTEDELKTILG